MTPDIWWEKWMTAFSWVELWSLWKGIINFQDFTCLLLSMQVYYKRETNVLDAMQKVSFIFFYNSSTKTHILFPWAKVICYLTNVHSKLVLGITVFFTQWAYVGRLLLLRFLIKKKKTPIRKHVDSINIQQISRLQTCWTRTGFQNRISANNIVGGNLCCGENCLPTKKVILVYYW